jgi:arginase
MGTLSPIHESDTPLATVEIAAVRARISESSPHDLRGVEALREALTGRLGASAGEPIRGRDGPFRQTPWQDDLRASGEVLTEAGARLRSILDAGRRPLLLATDCALALATLPALAQHAPEARVLWLDAHTDYDTPATTRIGFLGCMSLAGACGAWDSGFGSLPASRVVHVGARIAPGDFDEAGHREAEAGELTMISVGADAHEQVLAALGGAPVYVHLDPDVLDPSVNPLPYARPGGLSGHGLGALLEAVAGASPVLGLEITAFHAPDDRTESDRLTALLADAAHRLLDRS